MPYCERTGPGLFDEPINAVTNAAFFAAAWGAWSLAKRRNVLSPELWALIALSLSIGIGSSLWHTLARSWAQPLDVIPILLLQLSFIWVYGRRMVGLSGYVVALLMVGYLGAALLGRQHRGWLNGLPIYAPALLLSVAVGLYHWQAGKREPFLLLAAAGAFCIALLFRTIDRWVCPWWPLGTHFLWHLFNGVVVYVLLRAVIVNGTDLATMI